MPLKTSIGISAAMLLGIATVAVLYLSSYTPVNEKNGFKRTMANKLGVARIMHTAQPVTAISGYSGDRIYFQTKKPGDLLATDRELKSTENISLPVNADQVLAGRFNTYVDSNQVFIFAGNVPAILKSVLSTKTITPVQLPKAVFSRETFITPQRFVLRIFDTTLNKDQSFIKIGTEQPLVSGKSTSITDLRGDHGFSTDGLLHYDKKLNKLVYVFFYRNQFISIDTNLQVQFKAHTIDTTNTYQMVAGTVKKGNTENFTNVAPSRIINRESSVHDGLLYNYSTLKADNEPDSLFKHNVAIDVYDLQAGNYKYSFYIPHINGEKMKRFRVFDGFLVAIYKNSIATFNLEQ